MIFLPKMYLVPGNSFQTLFQSEDLEMMPLLAFFEKKETEGHSFF